MKHSEINSIKRIIKHAYSKSQILHEKKTLHGMHWIERCKITNNLTTLTDSLEDNT